MTDAVKTLKDWITESNNIVFFGGAGVSTESGIPDFRSVDGLYHQQYAYPPETILSRSFYEASPEEFYRFYRAKMLCLDAQPNAAHRKLAELEAAGKLRAVITQNIDGLHQKAGSRNVLELHGSVLRNYCTRCGAFHGVEAVSETTGVPIIGGTSLTVYPAAGLVHYYRGRELVVINKTELHGMGADLTISEPIGQVMAQV